MIQHCQAQKNNNFVVFTYTYVLTFDYNEEEIILILTSSCHKHETLIYHMYAC